MVLPGVEEDATTVPVLVKVPPVIFETQFSGGGFVTCPPVTVMVEPLIVPTTGAEVKPPSAVVKAKANEVSVLEPEIFDKVSISPLLSVNVPLPLKMFP